MELPRALQELVDEEPGPGLPGLPDHLVERVHPLLGLIGVDIGQLMLEFVEVHVGVAAPRRDRMGYPVERSRSRLETVPHEATERFVMPVQRFCNVVGQRPAPRLAEDGVRIHDRMAGSPPSESTPRSSGRRPNQWLMTTAIPSSYVIPAQARA